MRIILFGDQDKDLETTTSYTHVPFKKKYRIKTVDKQYPMVTLISREVGWKARILGKGMEAENDSARKTLPLTISMPHLCFSWLGGKLERE